ncbi:MAG: hypothetical protein ACYC6T_09890 [Thermoleophilia bacterium]
MSPIKRCAAAAVRTSPAPAYLAEGSYPIYILHQPDAFRGRGSRDSAAIVANTSELFLHVPAPSILPSLGAGTD